MDCLIMNSEIIKNKDKSIDINKLEKKRKFQSNPNKQNITIFYKKRNKRKEKEFKFILFFMC